MGDHLLMLQPNDRLLMSHDFVESNMYYAGECCGSCGDKLAINQEVFLVEVMQCQLVRDEVECYSVLDDDGDFLYAPIYMEFGCMEQLYEELGELIQDLPAIEDPGGSVIRCNQCHSGIRPWEYFCRVSFGEIRVSKRQPLENEVNTTFEVLAEPDALCLSCMRRVTTEALDLWPGQALTQDGACEEGIHARCWRWGSCPCPHKNQPGFLVLSRDCCDCTV